MFNRCTRTVAARLCALLYRTDAVRAAAIVRNYWIGDPDHDEVICPAEGLPGARLEVDSSKLNIAAKVPFVYDNPDAPHLKRLRERFDLKSLVAGAPGEYAAMLNLSEWLGARWDHGTDEFPCRAGAIDAILAIERGMNGAKFWCQIGAKVAVQAFSAMGWPARLATASRDGRTWEHAVAEVWSNQFCKWMAIDTDFNVVFEADGKPLSAYELCHDAPALQRNGALRTRLLGSPKPSLPLIDLLPFYASIFIDMRCDWNARPLRRGSPVGGDLSSWWTARPDFNGTLSPKIRVDDRNQFDWPVNIASARITDVRRLDDHYQVQCDVRAYAPYLASVQRSINDGPWINIEGEQFQMTLRPCDHRIAVRVKLLNGDFGPVSASLLHLPAMAASLVPIGALS
jgi:hypothetical protein